MHRSALALGRLIPCIAVVAACGEASSSPRGGAGGAGAAGGGAGAAAASGAGGVGTGGGGLDEGCANDVYQGELVPLGMHVMLDRSGSMQDEGKWTGVTKALKDFVALPELGGFSMGLGVFPVEPPSPAFCFSDADCGGGFCDNGQCDDAGTVSCDAADYSTPLVQISPLPGASSALRQAIDKQAPGEGLTPMTPALEGALQYAGTWAAGHPAFQVAVVLATDGAPSGCDPNEVTDVADRAAAALAGPRSIETFVIGIGSALSNLDAIAAAGGTGKAVLVETADTGQQFYDALDRIRGGLSCSMSIPEPGGGQQPDFGLLNVAFTPAGSSQRVFPKVDGAGDCGGEDGWYFDDPVDPGRIVLCPAACDLVTGEASEDGVLDVVLGCRSVVR